MLAFSFFSSPSPANAGMNYFHAQTRAHPSTSRDENKSIPTESPAQKTET